MDQPTIAPEAQPAQTPDIPQLASPGAMGGEVAAAGADLAAGVGQRLLARHDIDLKNQYEDQLTQAQLRIAGGRETLSAQMEQLQRDPNLDVKTYTDQVHGLFDQMASGVMDGVTNTHIQRTLAGQLADTKAQYGEQADKWQTMQQAGLVVAGSNQLFNKVGGQAYQQSDPASLTALNTQLATYVHALPGLTPDQRQQLVVQGVSQNASNFGYGLADRDPAQARALFDQGWFAQNGLKDQQLHVMDRAIRQGESRAEGKAHAAAVLADTTLSVQGETVMRTIEAGGSIPVPDAVALAKQVRKAAEDSTAAQKPKPELYALADRLDGAVNQMDVKARYSLQAPVDIEAASQAAQAEVARRRAAGEPITLQEGARLTAITTLAQQTKTAVQTDPWSLAAPRGVAPAPLDPNNPASFAQRTQQAQMLQGVLKLPYPVSPLQKDEAETMGKQVVNSEAGRIAALTTLDNFDPTTRNLAAKQVMPNDGGFAIEAGLDPFNRTVVQQGRERAAADVHFWSARPQGALPGDHPPAEAHIRDLGMRVDAALGPVADQTQVAGIKQTAEHWIAGMMVRQGKSNGIGITDTDVQNGLRAALGGHVLPNGAVTGGIGSWGSPNNVYVVPNSMTARDFSNFVGGQVATDRARGHGPVNPDGTPFNLTQAQPVYQGNGKYIWTTPAGVVMTSPRTRQAPQPYMTTGAQ